MRLFRGSKALRHHDAEEYRGAPPSRHDRLHGKIATLEKDVQGSGQVRFREVAMEELTVEVGGCPPRPEGHRVEDAIGVPVAGSIAEDLDDAGIRERPEG